MTGTLLDRLEAGGLFDRLGIRVPSVHQTLKGDLSGDDRYTLPFHQDYVLTRSRRAIRVWVPLRAVDAVAGTMELAVASHRDRFTYVAEDTDYPHIAESAIVGTYETVTLSLAAGSAVVFTPSLVHRSMSNRGRRMRFALIVHVDDATALHTQDEMAATAKR
jgi:ectoine hydroxylase-related dioxygenase (phytanoyl-CoA dioxygenase family)